MIAEEIKANEGLIRNTSDEVNEKYDLFYYLKIRRNAVAKEIADWLIENGEADNYIEKYESEDEIYNVFNYIDDIGGDSLDFLEIGFETIDNEDFPLFNVLAENENILWEYIEYSNKELTIAELIDGIKAAIDDYPYWFESIEGKIYDLLKCRSANDF